MSFEDLPEEWEVMTLENKDIADLIMGQSPPSPSYNKDGIGLPFLQGNAEFGYIYPSPTFYCSQPLKISEKNDILLSVRAPVGDVNINASKSCIGRGLAAIRSKKHKLDYLYLFYVLKFEGKRFQALSMGSTFKAIRKTEVKRFKIPLPPLPEQKRIAEVLSTVDSAIQKVDVASEKTERLKNGLMQRLLTEGIGHERFKFSKELGCEIPEEWEVVKLGDACKQRKETILPSGKGEYVFVGLEHIDSGETKLKRSVLDTNIKSSKFRFYSGDILYGKLRPYLDKAVISNLEGICSTDLLVLTPNKNKSRGEFLVYLIHSKNFIQRAIATTSGTNHPRTSWKEISKFKFGLPPLPEQHKIAEILSTVDKKLELEHQRKEKLNRVKRGLMNDMLTGRKRVKVEA